MAGSFRDSNKDSFEISELAALNEDISDDLISQLQNQISNDMKADVSSTEKPEVNVNDDSTLFEEAAPKETEPVHENVQSAPPEPAAVQPVNSETDAAAQPETVEVKKEAISINKEIDDNFIKKYKAKLNKKAMSAQDAKSPAASKEVAEPAAPENTGPAIESLSQGNISERPLSKDLKEYNDSLDFLDGNVKYSKYVIYIDPQNVDFIEGLTVKERKNLINSILRQQDDIAITKQRFKVIQSVLFQLIITVIVLAVSVPFIYHIINASLEATIENHRRSQTNWQTLYREHGKITQN